MLDNRRLFLTQPEAFIRLWFTNSLLRLPFFHCERIIFLANSSHGLCDAFATSALAFEVI